MMKANTIGMDLVVTSLTPDLMCWLKISVLYPDEFDVNN